MKHAAIACVFASAIAISACSRRPLEVNELTTVTSPLRQYSAQVNEVVYGPHFGGETPSVEVWLSDGKRSEVIFQAPEERNDVQLVWQSATRLKILHSPTVPVSMFKVSSLGVTIELSNE